MKLITALLLLFALLPVQLFCQSHISGTVIDKQSKLPVDFASVYINGTTNGTLTDSLGNFHLNNVRFPCSLVVSRLSYRTQSMELKQPLTVPLSISLKLKMNEIGEVSVLDKNLREKNMKTFRDQFLGTDAWGKYAVIENEEVIKFSRDYIQKQSKVIDKKLTNSQQSAPDLQWSTDSTEVTYSKPVNLKATSLQPLKINLPLLGYTLYYDLVGFVYEFEEDFGADLSATLGFSYFVPVPFESKRDSIRIAKNREKAYYNSAQHFCKSLCENRLAQNGYRLLEPQPQNTTPTNSKFYYSDNVPSMANTPANKPVLKKEIKEVKLDTCIHKLGEYNIATGLKDKKFDIQYYNTTNNKPKDLTLYKGKMGKKSEIIFSMDTCIIRKDGTVPDNSIIFGKEIGLKKVGAMLPGDYQPVY